MHRPVALLFVSALIGLASCGGGPGDVGDFCSTPGSQEECIDGAVCDKLEDGDIQCLLVCVDQADCPDDFNCEGTSGTSVKSCHPLTVK